MAVEEVMQGATSVTVPDGLVKAWRKPENMGPGSHGTTLSHCHADTVDEAKAAESLRV